LSEVKGDKWTVRYIGSYPSQHKLKSIPDLSDDVGLTKVIYTYHLFLYKHLNFSLEF